MSWTSENSSASDSCHWSRRWAIRASTLRRFSPSFRAIRWLLSSLTRFISSKQFIVSWRTSSKKTRMKRKIGTSIRIWEGLCSFSCKVSASNRTVRQSSVRSSRETWPTENSGTFYSRLSDWARAFHSQILWTTSTTSRKWSVRLRLSWKKYWTIRALSRPIALNRSRLWGGREVSRRSHT